MKTACVETKWNDYDAPWETIEEPNEETQRAFWREYYLISSRFQLGRKITSFIQRST